MYPRTGLRRYRGLRVTFEDSKVNKLIDQALTTLRKETAQDVQREVVQLKRKLKTAIAQRDEWRYQAVKYRARILELKAKK